MCGRERAGLENDDMARANALITVPVNPGFSSLNLAQSVLLTGYEWQRAQRQSGAEDKDGEPGRAGQAEIERLAGHYQERLEQAGFFFPETKAEGMKINLRNMWSRMPLTRADVRMLHGVMRQMVRWKDRDD